MNKYLDNISHIQSPNYDHIARTRPHRLYADNTWCRIELSTHTIVRLMWEVSGKSGVILGLTHSWNWGSQTQTFFLHSEWGIYSIGQFSGLKAASIDIMLFYMLLNPLTTIDGWVLQDVHQAKKENAPNTNRMIWMESSWGKTDTFHPDLEAAIQNSIAIIRGMS